MCLRKGLSSDSCLRNHLISSIIIQNNLSAGNYRTLFIPIVSYVSIDFCGFLR